MAKFLDKILHKSVLLICSAITSGGIVMRLRKESDSMQDDEVLLIAKVSDALAHPARINIYRFIMQCNRDRVNVCNKDVVAAFDYSQATVSQHIKKLVDSSLIQVKNVNRFSYYFANMGALARYLAATKKFGQI